MDTPSSIPSNTTATVHPPAGLTLERYAEAKGVDAETLKTYGLSTVTYQGAPVVKMPYFNPTREVISTQYRVRLDKAPGGDDRFRFGSGSKAVLYGQDRLADARERDYVTLTEGASDCHTLWAIGEPAIGLPGAAGWKEERDAPLLDGIETIYIVIEPDTGGETVMRWLAVSSIRDRVRLVNLGEHKDPSGLYLADRDRFAELWAVAKADATPYVDVEAAEERDRTAEAWEACSALAHEPNILARFQADIEADGVAGVARVAKVLYLAITSRVLPRPISTAVKGPSSGGKSYVVERVLDYFPAEAYYALTAMSERALIYDDEPLVHRMMVVYEAAGMAGDTASYLMRSLLSEGLIRYSTVETTAEGVRPLLIERPGPTGLIVTTTAVHLHPENETRLLSLTVDDSKQQTRRVFRSLASECRPTTDTTAWHALQVWLAGQTHDVTIPYAAALAELVPDSTVRLRRDFGMILNMIRAHAILHTATRDRDTDGRLVATFQDYAVVRDLIAETLAEGLEATVPPTVRETVATVATLCALQHVDDETGDVATVTVSTVAKALKLDKSAASRRVKVAVDREYLRNLETGRGRPLRLTVGDPMPEDGGVLPTVEELAGGCTVAGASEGVSTERSAPEADADAPYVDTAAHIRTLSPNDRAVYRAEVASAPADDPDAAFDRAALALADRLGDTLCVMASGPTGAPSASERARARR